MDETGHDDLDEDEIDITLRPPGEVAVRILVLGAVCRRAHLELEPDEVDDPEGERFDLAGWLREERIAQAMTAPERALIETRVGRLDRDLAGDASWRVEALAVLAWAAGVVADAPSFEAPVEPTAILAAVPSPWDTTAAFRKDLALRPEAEIAALREAAEIWHWRGTLEPDLRETTGRQFVRLRDIVREVAREAKASGAASALDQDFRVDELPYHALPADRVELLTDVAAERLRALNWLCGFGTSLDDAPLDI